LDVRAIRLPEKEDPDSFLRSHSREEFENLYRDAVDFITYYLERNAAELKTPAAKTQFVERLAEELIEIKNPVTLDLIVGEVAGRINVREEHLQAQMRFVARRRSNQSRVGNNSEKDTGKSIKLPTSADKAEYELLKIILSRQESLQTAITGRVKAADFRHPVLHSIAEKLLVDLKEGPLPEAGELFNKEWNEDQRLYLARLILDAEPFQFSEDTDLLRNLTRDCLTVLLTFDADTEIHAIRDKIKAAEKKGEDSTALVLQLSIFRQKRRDIENSLKT